MPSKACARVFGVAPTKIYYTNIYHTCLAKLLEECAETQGECKGCPVENPCLNWWSHLSETNVCGTNCYKITAENFPYLVLQFMKYREKAREKSHMIIKANGKTLQKELVSGDKLCTL